MGKVKPIRIIPPSSNDQIGEDENKIKFQNSLIKSTTPAWDEETGADNQKDYEHHLGDRYEDNEDIKNVEQPEKMFINMSELGATKYYIKKKGASLPGPIIGEEEDDMLYENMKRDNNNKSNNNNNNIETREIKDEEEEATQKARSTSKRQIYNKIDESVDEDAEEEEEKPHQNNNLRAVSAPAISHSMTSSAMSKSSSASCSERVKVIVRSRPMSQKELDQGHEW